MCAPLVMGKVYESISRRQVLGLGVGALGAMASRGLAQPEVSWKGFTKLADLTHTLSPRIPLFPGAEPMRRTTLVTVRQNGYYGNW